MFLDPRSNTCPLAALWNTIGPKCLNYVDTDIYLGLYNACVHEANKKDGTCPMGYVKNPRLHVVDEKPLKYLVDRSIPQCLRVLYLKKESSNELDKEMD